MSKLKSLNQFNAEMMTQAVTNGSYQVPEPNGIECPKCGAELLDSNPLETLTSNPPQKRIHCKLCGFTGYRYC